MFSSGLFVVHDTSGGGHDDITVKERNDIIKITQNMFQKYFLEFIMVYSVCHQLCVKKLGLKKN